jgi:hypothetical protein
VKSCEEYLIDNERLVDGRRRGSLTSGKDGGGVAASVPKGYETIWGGPGVPSASEKVKASERHNAKNSCFMQCEASGLVGSGSFLEGALIARTMKNSAEEDKYFMESRVDLCATEILKLGFCFHEIPVFTLTLSKSMAFPGDHFEATVCVLVAISNRNFLLL